MSLQGVNLGEFNFLEYAPDALKGVWIRKWDDFLKLTVVRGHAILTSIIATNEIYINQELPAHSAFYLSVLSSSGVRTVLVDKDQPVSMTLAIGEQIQATFTIGDENGL